MGSFSCPCATGRFQTTPLQCSTRPPRLGVCVLFHRAPHTSPARLQHCTEGHHSRSTVARSRLHAEQAAPASVVALHRQTTRSAASWRAATVRSSLRAQQFLLAAMATRAPQQTPVPFASSVVQAAAPTLLDSCSPAPAANVTATGVGPSSAAAAAPAGEARRHSGEEATPVFQSGARALNLADFDAASSFASSSVSSRRGPRQGVRLAFSGAAGAVPAAAMASPASDDGADGEGARRSLTMLLEGESDDEDEAPAHAAANPRATDAPAGGAEEEEEEVVVVEEGGDAEEEEEDDEAFARRLMREESMLAYQQLQQASVEMALASMRGQAGDDDVDEDTRLSLQLMMAEVQAMNGGDEEQMARLAEAAEVIADAEAEEGATADGMGYDELLQLGEQLGDVRKERWQARAPALIAALPRGEWSGSGEPMCAICRCEWEAGSADVMKLPCGHEFHEDCGEHWLRDNDSCPCCKASIEATQAQAEEAQEAEADEEAAAEADPVLVGEGSPQERALASAAARVAGRTPHTAVAAMAAAAAAIGSPGGDAVAAALHHAAAAASAGAPSAAAAAGSSARSRAAAPSPPAAAAAADAAAVPGTPLAAVTPCTVPPRRSRKRPEPEPEQ